jgi:hypothetical protein
MTGRQLAILSVTALAAGTVMVTGGRRILERQRTAAEISRLRDGLYRARVAADRCRRGLVNSRSAIEDLDLRLDSLRARVDSFEALDPRGVPEAEYDRYLESFGAFNDSVAAYESQAGRVRGQDAACRDVIREHNLLRDSLQTVLRSAGIMEP